MKYLFLIIVLVLTSTASFAQLQTINVTPSATDVNINTYTNAAQQEVHICYYNTAVTSRNELLVFFPGTGGKPNGNDYFDQLAANLGYHVIGLMYPNDTAIGAICQYQNDSVCFEKNRLEIIDGTDRSIYTSVNRANSIENRLIKCIQYLNINYPSQNWGQYLDINDSLIWNKLAFAGHSQGGGHAALIAKYHDVARVICLASPKDYFVSPINMAAKWIDTNHVTSTNRYFSFTHVADQTGCTPAQQQEIFDLLGMRTIADSISVDANTPPYNNSRILMTYLAVANGTTINPHGCVLVDNKVPDIQTTGTNLYLDAWTYMLTANTSTLTSLQNNIINEKIWKIYPNPFSDKINLTNSTGLEDYFLSNMFGQLIWTGKHIDQQNFSNLTNGIYFLKLKRANNEQTIKMIKQ